MSPESHAITSAAEAMQKSAKALRESINNLADVQQKAAASTDRLGSKMLLIAVLAAFATVAQAITAVVALSH